MRTQEWNDTVARMHGAAARARAAATISRRGLGNGMRRRWETRVTGMRALRCGRCSNRGAEMADRSTCRLPLRTHGPRVGHASTGPAPLACRCNSVTVAAMPTARLGIVRPRCSSLKHHQMPPKNRTEVPLSTFLSKTQTQVLPCSTAAVVKPTYNWRTGPVRLL